MTMKEFLVFLFVLLMVVVLMVSRAEVREKDYIITQHEKLAERSIEDTQELLDLMGELMQENDNLRRQLNEKVDVLNPVELDLLHRIVEAEAQGEPLAGKAAVVSVVLNRVESENFPATITEVIEQPRQFQPVTNGRIDRIKPSEGTIEAVSLVLEEGTTTDALYFMNAELSDPGNRAWMESLDHVGTVGNHDFYI